jgi:glycine/D-amino acid oxidase-like deaminating enzyme
LKQAGLKVVVLEKNTIASGTSGGTTGKVTTQHGLIYAELIAHFGKKFARQYADLSRQAFDDIQQLVTTQKINCNWHRADNFVYTARRKNITKLQKEATAAAGLGLPATFERHLDLPFKTRGAVKFADQAYFNTPAYVRALAKLVSGNGSCVYERSQARKFREGSSCLVKTARGQVTAKHVVIATKVPPAPLVGRLSYALNEYPVTSYIVAGPYSGSLQGMYISPDKSHYSLLPVDAPGRPLLLVGGESHLPGIHRSKPRQAKLARYAQKHFGLRAISYRWKAMDYIGYDSLPLIGRLYPWSENAFVIGGFKKWGLNLSMVAANLLRDVIVDDNKKSLEVFSPQRLSTISSLPRAVVKYFQ